MKRTEFDVWAVDGPAMDWVYQLKADAQDKMQDLAEDGQMHTDIAAIVEGVK